MLGILQAGTGDRYDQYCSAWHYGVQENAGIRRPPDYMHHAVLSQQCSVQICQALHYCGTASSVLEMMKWTHLGLAGAAQADRTVAAHKQAEGCLVDNWPNSGFPCTVLVLSARDREDRVQCCAVLVACELS